ncbi:hypothetical protein, partial [Psychrobacter sp. CAL346-MNA-CIBAN-0220]|uniref:hypothetical protein n=1 Tax=Psychrobacter sp. CAL346-MNA-CIBAN-0220 TaxID=3140457 RepID=UPI003321911C
NSSYLTQSSAVPIGAYYTQFEAGVKGFWKFIVLTTNIFSNYSPSASLLTRGHMLLSTFIR